MTTAALASAAAALVVLCVVLVPGPLPPLRDPRLIDVVFDSRPVIWAARLLLMSAAFVLAIGGAFVVASTMARMRNGDWLKRAGPFEIAETTVAELEDQVHLWQSAALDYYDALEAARARIGDSSHIID